MTNGRAGNDGPTRVAKTTMTSFEIVEALSEGERMGVSELARTVGLAKGTVHKHLTTLHRLNYVVNEDGAYRLGLRFLGLGVGVRNTLPVHGHARRHLDALAEATGEVASLVIPEHGYGVYVRMVTGERDGGPPYHEGERVYLHATAGGKALLAYLPDEERERILETRGLPPLTDNTITSRAELRTELQSIRDRRIAYDREEHVEGWRCVAAPITDAENRAVGAVSVSGPAERMMDRTTDADISGLLGSTASAIQNKLLSP
ncbi:IclR family transcriptional regulator [Halegenticoccus tardaugens]|uniref:IclR family transcriptional regulator n=1 Tax=Halegenticoccus tardaugens TaxID=2071624 RepID=UPI00100AA572|nr:IclR family transcriptional regulator [Halegenticoccus tardaugens]